MTTPTAEASAVVLRHGRRIWWTAYLLVFGAALTVVFLFRSRAVFQPYLTLSLGIFGLMLGAWLLRPRVALCGTLFLTMASDAVFLWWFPFTKNLSSRESISFVADAITTSPLELSLVAGFATSVLRTYGRSGRLIERSPLTRPIVVFTVFVTYGFVLGIATGGDFRIAVFEGRSLFYILLVFVIVTNDCREPGQLRTAFWWVLGGVTVHSILALEHLYGLSPQDREELQSLGDHGASIAMNVLVLTLALAVVLRPVPRRLWALLAIVAVPVTWAYLYAQRRAAVAALAVAVIILMMAVGWLQPRTFRRLAPVIVIVSVGYLAAFWSSDTTAGFPAQAVKTVVASDEISEQDRSSNLYRTYENFNVNYTIRTAPITGLGFGHPFLTPVRLPEITNFVVRDFVPHNSLLWIWIKTGFFGFAALLYLIARTVVTGVERVRRIGGGIDVVVRLASVAFVAMYAVYAYLDILWDVRNTVLLGLTMAICGSPLPATSEMRGVAGRETSADQTGSLNEFSEPRSARGTAPADRHLGGAAQPAP